MQSISFEHLLLVGAGGFVGAVLRYVTSLFALRIAPGSALPPGTLLVNVVGSLVLGALYTLAESRQLLSPEARLLLATGVLGSFTTFSTFAHETLVLGQGGFGSAEPGSLPLAAANICAHLCLGLAAAWLGSWLAR